MSDPIVAYGEAMLNHHGLDPALFRRAGASVVPVADRVGSRTASAYAIGQHLVVLCDPEVAGRIAGFDPEGDDAQARLVDYASFATALGSEVLGSGQNRVLTAPVAASSADDAIVVDRDNPGDVERLRVLLDATDPADVEEAEIEIDDLDSIIRCTEAEPGGAITAYASARPWDEMWGMWDIGTLTHPEHRRQGLGLRALRRLTVDLQAAGHDPLYRHEIGNVASGALAGAAGYAVACTLTAVRFRAT